MSNQETDPVRIADPPPQPQKTPAENAEKQNQTPHSATYAPYPKLDPSDVAPPPLNLSSVPVELHSETKPDSETGSIPTATAMPVESNPYVSPSPAQSSSSSVKNTVDSMKDVLGKWGKMAADASKKANNLAGDMWQHLKTGPSVADAAMSRIAQSTKILAEGGYEKVFGQTFENAPDEKLKKSFACYLSTSAGPVVGVLYLSSLKLAFCSDNPLAYKVGEETQHSYYKVVIPVKQLRAVNPSTSRVNPSEKYVQVISIDNHEFWFMGFVNYESAVSNIQKALLPAET